MDTIPIGGASHPRKGPVTPLPVRENAYAITSHVTRPKGPNGATATAWKQGTQSTIIQQVADGLGKHSNGMVLDAIEAMSDGGVPNSIGGTGKGAS